jgi:hypothetical protein
VATVLKENNISVYIVLDFHKQKTAITYYAPKCGMYSKQNTLYTHTHIHCIKKKENMKLGLTPCQSKTY